MSEKELKKKKSFEKIIKAFRKNYYSVVMYKLNNKVWPFKCFAGTSFAELLPSGDIITCGVRKEVIANIKDYNFNFSAAWNSKGAKEVRKKIKREKCFCMMSNPIYSSMILNYKFPFLLLKSLF